jgi:hypothetical protein
VDCTSGCAFIMACLRVRWGSSVYVQKKSCSFGSNEGGAAAVSFGSALNLEAAVLLLDLELVIVEVVDRVTGGILKD